MSDLNELIAELNRDLAKADELITAGQLDQASSVIKSILSRMEENLELHAQIPLIRLDLVRVEAQRGHFQMARTELDQVLSENLTEAEALEVYLRIRSWTPTLESEFVGSLLERVYHAFDTLGYEHVAVKTLTTRGVLAVQQGNVEQALDLFLHVQQRAHKHGLIDEEIVALRNLSQAYFKLGYRAHSLEYFMRYCTLMATAEQPILSNEFHFVERLCTGLEAPQVLVAVLGLLAASSAIESTQRFEWLERLLEILVDQESVLTHAIFELSAKLLLDLLQDPNIVRTVNWSSHRVARLYQKAISVAAPLVQEDSTLAPQLIMLGEIMHYYQAQLRYSLPTLEFQSQLSQLAHLETQRDSIVSGSLGNGFRLSERSEKLRDIEKRIVELSSSFISPTQEAQDALIPQIAPPEGSLKALGSDSFTLGLHPIVSPRGVVVYLIAPGNADIMIKIKRLPEFALESALTTLSRYPESEIDFLVEYLSDLVLPENLLDLLEHSATSRLTVVGGPLVQSIPWEAIRKEDLILGSRFALTRTFTLSRPSSVKVVGKGEAVILADPTGDLNAAREEAVSVEQQLREHGMKVTLILSPNADDLLLHSSPLQILHYAGHGNFLQTRPEASYLRFHDRPVTLAEIARLKTIQGALVVLNACETASMPHLDNLMKYNLIQPFLDAGASSVIGGLWPVRDGAAAELIGQLYTNLLAGDKVSIALREARAVLRRQGYPTTKWASHALFGAGNWQLKLEDK